MGFSQLHPNIKLRVATIFFNTLTSNMVFPFMTIYFANTIGLTYTSLVVSIAIIVNFIAGILGGYYADRLGRKKVMLVADGAKFLTFLLMALSNSPWTFLPVLTLIGFLLNSVCTGVYGPASEAMLLDDTKPEQRRYMYSLIYWSSNLSIAIGGTVGALMFEDYLFTLFVCLVASALFSLGITYYLLTETYELSAAEQQNSRKDGFRSLLRNYRTVVRDRVFMVFVISGMLLFSLERHLTNYIGIRLESDIQQAVLQPFGWTVSGIELLGYLRTENTICVILLSIVATKFLKGSTQKSEQNLLFIGFLLFLFGYGMLATSVTPWVLFTFMVVAVIGEVIFVPIHESYLGDLAPNHLRSSYLALNKTAFKGSALVGSAGIYIGSVFSSTVFSIFVWVSGIIGFGLFYAVMPQIYQLRKASGSAAETPIAG
ncbi:MFS transporter [Paenibacillus sambharensis]|uniref:MFS transporter n=1 Tax=Paenibacillus sambharensis TaxID=1803190 RepID=A0A2W1LFG7_9BACL|nr:MFS transporter [Paenibacillus sambharensis]PZD96790.1 MFS transporter [Paenibacillus sambharensis]